MANTISELYEKYAEQVEGALEEDRYFQYLFEMVQAGGEYDRPEEPGTAQGRR